MQGIDISYAQAGLDLSKVRCDFVIIRSSHGMTVDPHCDGFYQQAKQLNRMRGVYHYVEGGDAIAEADFWVSHIQGYLHDGIICVDFEDGCNAAAQDFGYLDRFVGEVKAKTGIAPLIYGPAKDHAKLSGVADAHGCGLWIAQYADNSQTGYQDTPWNEGAYACAIRQYSSVGRLSGWPGNLDLDKAYFDSAAWAKYAGAKPSEAAKWIKKDTKWWYRHADGSYTRSGWEQIAGAWYLFDADGWMLTGWQQVGGEWYLLADSGAMLTGWQKVDSKWYYLTDSGAMAIGWLQKDGKWYYLDPATGAMHAADVQQVGGKWYAFGPSGEMRYGVGSDASGALEV